MYQKNLQRITTTQDNWQQSGTRLTTGKRVITPSDDPSASAQALLLKQARARNQQLQEARKDAKSSLGRQETVLSDVTKVIYNIKQTLVRAGNEILSDSDRKVLKEELTGYKKQLVSLSNATDGKGNYIFGGYRNNIPPFIINNAGEVSEVGGDMPIEVAIDDSGQIPVSHNGIDVFLTGSGIKEPDGSPAESSIFKSIDHAVKTLNFSLDSADKDVVEEYRRNIGKAARGMDNALENNSRVRSEGGLILAQIDQLTELGETSDVNYQLEISGLEDANIYDAIAENLMLQAILLASQKVFLSMQNMSLFQLK